MSGKIVLVRVAYLRVLERAAIAQQPTAPVTFVDEFSPTHPNGDSDADADAGRALSY